MTHTRGIPDDRKKTRHAVDNLLMEIGGFLCFGSIFFFIMDLIIVAVTVVVTGAIVFLTGFFLKRSRKKEGC